MSSCAASSCTCCPKVSSAFATLASSPTAAAPLSCRFAFNYSTHRTPSQKLPLPRNRFRFGSVPNVAVPWRLSRDLLLPNSNSVLHLFSQEPLHDTPITFSLPRCFPSPAAVVRDGCPTPSRWLRPSLANYNRTRPICTPVSSITDSPRSYSSLQHH